MDLRRTPANESGRKASLSITSALVSAVLEWMLMFMIFVDASFSYLVTRFARCCHLQIPCLLCSRLDHAFGNERAGFYWDLICHNHKLKISSLVLCQLHNNLVDVHRTCENCFFSFATINKSNAETYRLLVSKLGAEPYYDLAQGASSDEHNNGSSSTRKCLCCNEQWVSRTRIQKLFSSRSIDSVGAKHDALSSIAAKYNGDEVQEITEESSLLGQTRNKDTGRLPHVGYTQIKVTSDTESEGPFSDNESASALIHEMETSGPDSAAKHVYLEPQIINVAHCPTLDKLIHPAPPVKSLSESEDPTNTHHNVETEATLGYGLEELNWQQADHKNDVSEPSELISFSEVLHSPNINGIHYDESQETNFTSTTELEKEVHVECGVASSLESDTAGTAELLKEVTSECGEASGVGNESNPETEIKVNLKPNKIDTSSQMAESLDLGDAYKLAVGTRGRQLSGRFLEQQRSMTDSIKASEDVKLLLSQLSAARDMSPRVSANSEDFKAMDASGATGMQTVPRRISLERNESSLSLDGSTISEIEGESVADRLRRQVEHDKKIIGSLYKELEEERNASAIAANQAMAMITRLQEEKAALHMEALQSIRMMEEQAEYDDEALQKANDLLTEREKQIQDLEYELELLRNQYGDVSLSGTFVTPMPRPESDAGEPGVQKLEANYQESNITAFSNLDNDKQDIVNRTDGAPKILDGDTNTGKISLPQFKDEKHYILQCLKILEEKLVIFTKGEGYAGMVDGAFPKEEALEASANYLDCMRASQENGGTEKDHSQGDKVLHKETPQDPSERENSQHGSKGCGKLQPTQRASIYAELDAFRNELSVMSKRLEALEAEQTVIECSINSLEKGSEGFEFIQEIAVHLQELHSAHIRTRSEDLI